MLYFIQQKDKRAANKPEIPDEDERKILMTTVQNFKVIQSQWPNADGEYLFTITDGVDEKGEFHTREEAEANMEHIILNWRCDN